MNRNPLTLMKEIAEKLNVPYAVNEYTGPAKEFCVYKEIEVAGNMFADNRAQEHIIPVEFHYIQPAGKSFNDKIFEIMDELIAKGFTEPQITIVNDSNKYTILQFSTEIIV